MVDDSEYKDDRLEYSVTKLGSVNFVNGRQREVGAIVKVSEHDARFYLEQGWVESVKSKRPTKHVPKVHNS